MADDDLEAQVRAATVSLPRWVDTLADRLAERFDCEVREATTEEVGRPVHGEHALSDPAAGTSFAVQPRSPEAATLVVVRREFFTGTRVTLTFGEVGSEVVPCCDECAVLPPSDPGADELVEQADATVWAVTRGFAEFRRRNEDTSAPGLELEEGWFYSGGGASWSPAASPGPPFHHVWRPWQRRRGQRLLARLPPMMP